MNKKKKTILIITVIICLAALAIVGILVFPKTASRPEETVEPTAPETTVAPAATEEQPTEAETTAPTEKGYHEVQPGEDISSTVVDVKRSPEYVEPGRGALDLDKIQGLTPSGSGSGGSSSGTQGGGNQSGTSSGSQSGGDKSETPSEPQGGGDKPDTPSEPQGGETEPAPTPKGTVLSDPNLTAEVIAKYAGSFVEDGTNTATADVTAMVITNNSDQMLQIGVVEFQVNGSETAEFTVTNLPAGASALVMENSRRTFHSGDDFSYGKVASSYIDMPSLESDKFDILEGDGKLTLVNKTGESYGKVYVYYKYVQLGGAYLGGITYRVPFENVPANGQVESLAGHFRPDGSKIVGVVIMPE